MKTRAKGVEHMMSVFTDVQSERFRQDDKFGWIGTPGSILPGDDDWQKYAVLGEEFGEVGRALIERSFGNDTTAHLEEELIQCAAVCVAWVEAAREKRATATGCRECAWMGVDLCGTPYRCAAHRGPARHPFSE